MIMTDFTRNVYRNRTSVGKFRRQTVQCQEECVCLGGGGSWYKLPEPGGLEKSPSPNYVVLYFCLFLYYFYLSTVKINPLRPSPSHSTSISQSSLFCVKTFRRFVSAARHKKFFSPVPEPALCGLSN